MNQISLLIYYSGLNGPQDGSGCDVLARQSLADPEGSMDGRRVVPLYSCPATAPSTGHASDSHWRVPWLPGRRAREGPPPPPPPPPPSTELSPTGLAGSRGRSGREVAPAGSQVAKKKTWSLFKSKTHHSYNNLGLEPAPSR